MFGKKSSHANHIHINTKNISTKKFSEVEINKAKKASQQFTQAVDKNLKIVEKMDNKTYLKYYIGVLEKQIEEATKILEQKKQELKKMK